MNNSKLVICLSNDEQEIIDLINRSVHIVDLFIIDSIAEVLTENEKEGFDMNEIQNMPKLLNTLSRIIYGEDTALVAVNYVTFKDNKTIPKWDIAFQQYCTARIGFREDKSLVLISHKLRPDLVKGEYENELYVG